MEEDIHGNIIMNRPSQFHDAIFHDPGQLHRPNQNWHIHRGPNFVSFVHISEQAIQIDRYVKFIENTNTQEIFMNGVKIELENFENNVDNILERVELLVPCPGTGHNDMPRAQKCRQYLEAGKKGRPPPRCFECHLKKKSIDKGKRRAMASQVVAVKRKLKKSKQIKSMREKITRRNRKVSVFQYTMIP